MANALVTQLTLVVGFRLKHHPRPLQARARWWMVSSTLIDLMCLEMLTWLTRREGIRLTNLLSMQRGRLAMPVHIDSEEVV